MPMHLPVHAGRSSSKTSFFAVKYRLIFHIGDLSRRASLHRGNHGVDETAPFGILGIPGTIGVFVPRARSEGPIQMVRSGLARTRTACAFRVHLALAIVARICQNACQERWF